MSQHLSYDWIQGTLQLESVQVLLNWLESRSGVMRRSCWCMAPMGLFNYKHRMTWCALDWISVCWNPSVDDLDLYKDQIATCRYDHKQVKKLTASVSCLADVGEWLDTWQGQPHFYNFQPLDQGLNPGVFIQITGKGCHLLYDLGLMDYFVLWLREHHFRASRVDYAYDIINQYDPYYSDLCLAFTRCLDEASGVTLRSRSRLEKNVQIISIVDRERSLHSNLVFGSHTSSSVMFRCYDKAHEQRYNSGVLSEARKDALAQISYWQRYEYETHSDFAAFCFALDLDAAFGACMDRCFTPVARDDSNISRCSVLDSWNRFRSSQNSYFVYNCKSNTDRCDTDFNKRFKYLVSNGKSFVSQLGLLMSGGLDRNWFFDALRKGSHDLASFQVREDDMELFAQLLFNLDQIRLNHAIGSHKTDIQS